MILIGFECLVLNKEYLIARFFINLDILLNIFIGITFIRVCDVSYIKLGKNKTDKITEMIIINPIVIDIFFIPGIISSRKINGINTNRVVNDADTIEGIIENTCFA